VDDDVPQVCSGSTHTSPPISLTIERISLRRVVLPFSYADQAVPKGYQCADCGATGVRLYREYQTCVHHQHLRCRKCACKKEGREPGRMDEHSIGGLVAAVPTEDGETYWGYTSVPPAGVEWWNHLPRYNVRG